MTVLEGAEDEELQCYLLQLVQALRFERSDKSRLSYFLVKRGTDNSLVDNIVVTQNISQKYLGFYFKIICNEHCLELRNLMWC